MVRSQNVAGLWPDWIGQSLTLGNCFNGGEGFNGSLDEVRISNVARSAAWINATYQNEQNLGQFMQLGVEELPLNYPVVSAPSPSDKSGDVPISTSQLSFTLTDLEGNLMNYNVWTSPDIGSSGNVLGVSNGVYTLPIQNLAYATTYQWTVTVTNGNNQTRKTFSFTTQYPNDTSSTTNLLMPFETDSSSTVTDFSGNGNNGVIVGNVQWTSSGKVGGAYNFTGGFIQVPGTDSLDGRNSVNSGTWSQLTVEEWIYLSAYQSGTRTIARIPSYEIGISNDQVFVGVWIQQPYPNMSSYHRVIADKQLQTKQWYHVAFTFNSSDKLRLYINGVEVKSAVVSSAGDYIQPSGPDNPLYIGWFDYFKGMIDEVRIYPTALSPTQISQSYSETVAGSSNSLTVVLVEIYARDVNVEM
jgi:hypothetical protein